MIPKRIYQFWNSHSHIPPELIIFQKYHQHLFPDFEFVFWDDHQGRAFLQKHYSWFIPIYDKYDQPIKRYDALRYFYIYHYGGIYIDTDSIFLRRIDSLLNALHDKNTALLGYQRHDTKSWDAIGNSFLAAPPQHPFFRYVIDELSRHYRLPVLMSTGPIFLTGCFHRYHHDNVEILEMPILYAMEWHDKRKKYINQDIQSIIENPKSFPEFLDKQRKLFRSTLVFTLWKGSWKNK